MTKSERELFVKMKGLLEDVLKSIEPNGKAVTMWLGLVKETITQADRVLEKPGGRTS